MRIGVPSDDWLLLSHPGPLSTERKKENKDGIEIYHVKSPKSFIFSVCPSNEFSGNEIVGSKVSESEMSSSKVSGHPCSRPLNPLLSQKVL